MMKDILYAINDSGMRKEWDTFANIAKINYETARIMWQIIEKIYDWDNGWKDWNKKKSD